MGKTFLIIKKQPAPAVITGENVVNFYDYDGTLVADYIAADFANLSALPSNPSHTGLVADGWNWTLADAKTYVMAYEKLNIGQMYHTASGKTEYDIVVDEASGFTATLNNSAEKDWGDGTVDTNTTHTYAAAGNYTIKMGGTSLPSIQGSKKVRAVRIASGVTSIGDNAFYNCYSLQSVVIPSGVTSIGVSAFQSCYSLQSVTIPSGVTSIGNSAFQSCIWLTIVTVLATTPPTLVSTSAIPSNVTKIYIPNGTLAAYQAATNWSSFSSKFVELPA